MLSGVKVLFALVSFFGIVALARDGCRQCSGTRLIVFKDYTLQHDAMKFVKDSLTDCATGLDYKIDEVNPTDCCVTADCTTPGNPSLCKSYEFTMTVWRYCGNGAQVVYFKPDKCVGLTCSIKNRLSFTCTKSVECWNACDIEVCRDK